MRRTLAAAFGILSLGGLLAGCGAVAKPPSKPPEPIEARILGPLATPVAQAGQFLGAQDGWIGLTVGDLGGGQSPNEGYLLRTRDGGRSWSALATRAGGVLAVDFLSPQVGFLLADEGGKPALLETGDGGRTVSLVSNPPGALQPLQLQFSSPQAGFVMAGGSLDVTRNGGRTWTTTAITGDVTGSAFAPPYFQGALHAFWAHQGGIFMSVDGGRTWREVYALPKSLAGYGGADADGVVTFASARLGYAALTLDDCWAGGCPDVILRTTDGGASWEIVSAATQGTLPGLSAPMTGPGGGITQMVAWGTGNVAVSNMYGVAESSDGGRTWSEPDPSHLGTLAGFHPQLSYSPQGGLLAVGGTVPLEFAVRELPGGGWRQLWPPPVPAQQVDFVTSRLGYGVGVPVDFRDLLRTVDGGRHWRIVERLPLQTATDWLSFRDTRAGFASAPSAPFAAQEAIWTTADGGRHWHRSRVGYPSYLRLFAKGEGIAVMSTTLAAPARLYVTADGGRTFRTNALPPLQGWQYVPAFATPDEGWVAAAQSGVLRIYGTDDQGRTWRRATAPRVPLVWSVDAFATDDRGNRWLELTLRTGGRFLQVLYTAGKAGPWREIRFPKPLAQAVWTSYGEVLSAVSSREAWLQSPIGLLVTEDGGRTWRSLSWPLPIP